MLDLLHFIALRYLALAVAVLAAWGAGHPLLAWLRRAAPPPWRDAWLEAALAATLGLGLYVCAFQWLGAAGALHPAVMGGLTAAGALAGAAQLYRKWRARSRRGPALAAPWRERASAPSRAEILALVLLACVALPTLLAPLAPPVSFDELMYHLPYAREVARDGTLGVYEWLRYPWFPYNVNLLFTAALALVDDVFPHLLSAFALWLSVLIVYRLGLHLLDRISACIAAGIWLALGDYHGALIDGAVALFVLAACVALWIWREADAKAHAAGAPGQTAPHAPRPAAWLVLGCFFLGLAAGSKYQALTFLPIIALFVLWRERRPHVLALALLTFLVPCIYWYVRNAIQTGDPFNPIGARVFGFSNWNVSDYQRQIADVRAHVNPPNLLYWGILLLPFTTAWRRSAALRSAGLFCAWSIAVWALSSRYPRYLTAACPLIALCAAAGWRQLAQWLRHGLMRALNALSKTGATPVPQDGSTNGSTPSRWPMRVAAVAVLVLSAAVSLYFCVRDVREIASTPATREAFLRARVPGYATLTWLRAHPQPGKLYQVALSDAIYYAPNPVWGDTLGPWRYIDFITLPPAQLARKLADQGFGTLVVHTGWAPALVQAQGFSEYFTLLHAQDGVNAYRVAAH
ncbi:MAG: hypothetical protein LBV61_04150 [Burkholderiaceae bacterium]|jgi:hypothetical protein|nr:hypothetical protein [Burkholderiaceae bacterium]